MYLIERNLKIYKYFKFFQNMLILGPIMVPFLIYKGLDYAEIFLLQSISAISVFVFEVPTGVIADKISRKFSISMSSIFLIVALLLYVFGMDFFIFTLAEVIFGLGLTMRSGVDSAILYESLISLKRKKEYQKIEMEAFSNIYIGQAIGSISSSLLYTISPSIPFIISLLFIIISLFTSFYFIEIKKHEDNNNSYFSHLKEGCKVFLHNPRIRWALYASAIIVFCIRISFWLYEPYFKGIRLDIAWYGTVFFGLNVICAISARVFIKKIENKRQRKIILLLGVILGISFLFPIIFFNSIGLIFIALGQIARGLYNPVMNFYINNQLSNKYRATVISMVSLSGNISFAIISPFIGSGLDKYGAKSMYLIVGIIALAGTIILLKVRSIQKIKSKKMQLLKQK